MHAAADAYARTARSGLAGPRLETEVLTRCTLHLQAARDEAENAPSLATALDLNRRAWSIFADGWLDDDSPLTKETRLELLRKAAFVFRRTGDATEARYHSAVDDIIRVNRAMVAALRGLGLRG